jgi:hypothetical protein
MRDLSVFILYMAGIVLDYHGCIGQNKTRGCVEMGTYRHVLNFAFQVYLGSAAIYDFIGVIEFPVLFIVTEAL